MRFVRFGLGSLDGCRTLKNNFVLPFGCTVRDCSSAEPSGCSRLVSQTSLIFTDSSITTNDLPWGLIPVTTRRIWPFASHTGTPESPFGICPARVISPLNDIALADAVANADRFNHFRRLRSGRLSLSSFATESSLRSSFLFSAHLRRDKCEKAPWIIDQDTVQSFIVHSSTL